jgi:hypothetical protein
MNTTKNEQPRFKVGDWVAFRFGARDVTARVIEDRGPIGVKGRRLYRISIASELGEPDAFELPGVDLEPAPLPDSTAVMNYLKGGGLVAILRTNLGGGPDQPRAWLTYTPSGKVTHTLLADQGLIGGAPVPFFALHEYKVFTGKQDQVLTFLKSFGLSQTEAGEVLAAVGMAP